MSEKTIEEQHLEKNQEQYQLQEKKQLSFVFSIKHYFSHAQVKLLKGL